MPKLCSMSVHELKKHTTRGFRALAIRTTDGQKFTVPHPQFILIGKYSIAVLDRQGFINNLDLLQIVSLREVSRRWMQS